MQGLVIDDSRVMRQVARQILEKLKYTVEEATDCDGALAACRRSMPDAILLDINITGSAPTEFLQRLRQEERGHIPHIVVLSTELDVPLLTGAIDAGADAYLLKPFDSETIAAALKAGASARGL